MKKIIERIDFLWKGNSGDLSIMWLSILLAATCVTQVFFTIYCSVIK